MVHLKNHPIEKAQPNLQNFGFQRSKFSRVYFLGVVFDPGEMVKWQNFLQSHGLSTPGRVGVMWKAVTAQGGQKPFRYEKTKTAGFFSVPFFKMPEKIFANSPNSRNFTFQMMFVEILPSKVGSYVN